MGNVSRKEVWSFWGTGIRLRRCLDLYTIADTSEPDNRMLYTCDLPFHPENGAKRVNQVTDPQTKVFLGTYIRKNGEFRRVVAEVIKAECNPGIYHDHLSDQTYPADIVRVSVLIPREVISG